MFFRHRHLRPSLFQLILLLLGIKCCCGKREGHGDEKSREEFKAKAKEFRAKMKEAFSVWKEEEKQAPKEAPAETQG